MNSFNNDLFTFDNFLSPKDSINNREPKTSNKSVGHYSLFSGYQEIDGQKTDFSVDEIKRKQKLYVSDSISSSRSPTPPRVKPMFNLSDIGKSTNLPPSTKLVLVEDIINNTIPADASPQLLNIKVMVLTSHKLISKLKEKKRKLLKRVSSPTEKKIIKKQIKSDIKKVQAKTTKEITKVATPKTQKKIMKAQELIKKLQTPSSAKSSPSSSPKVVSPSSDEDEKELLKKINKQLIKLQAEVNEKIKNVK